MALLRNSTTQPDTHRVQKRLPFLATRNGRRLMHSYCTLSEIPHAIGATAESTKQRLLLQKATLRLQGFNSELHVWIYGNRKQIGFDGFINFIFNVDIALEHAPIEQQAR